MDIVAIDQLPRKWLPVVVWDQSGVGRSPVHDGATTLTVEISRMKYSENGHRLLLLARARRNRRRPQQKRGYSFSFGQIGRMVETKGAH
jgi:hypothetical protein